MKILTLILLTALSFQTGGKPDLIQSETPFSTSGVIKIEADGFAELYKKIGRELPPSMSESQPKKIETGNLNGVSYRFYYSDGSGSFVGREGGDLDASEYKSNWSVGCIKDAINDHKMCYMSRGDFRVLVGVDRTPMVLIGSNHYPRSKVVIRLDDDPAIENNGVAEGEFSPSASRRIVERLMTAKKATTRYYRWPNGTPTESWNVYGFKESYEYVRWAVVRIK